LLSPEDALLGVVLEVRRQRFVPSLCSDEEAFSADAFAAALGGGSGGGKPAADAFGCRPPALPTEELSCPHCKRAVGAARFAPHLQNCLGKGRNAQRAAKRGAVLPTQPPYAWAKKRTDSPTRGRLASPCCMSHTRWMVADASRTHPGAPPAELYVPSWSPKARPKKAKAAASKAQHWDDAFLPPGFHTRTGGSGPDAPALRTVDVMTWAPKDAGNHKAAPTPAQGAGQHSAPHTAPVQSAAQPPAGCPGWAPSAPAPRHGKTSVAATG
jgi:hypothetical protein